MVKKHKLNIKWELFFMRPPGAGWEIPLHSYLWRLQLKVIEVNKKRSSFKLLELENVYRERKASNVAQHCHYQKSINLWSMGILSAVMSRGDISQFVGASVTQHYYCVSRGWQASHVLGVKSQHIQNPVWQMDWSWPKWSKLNNDPFCCHF